MRRASEKENGTVLLTTLLIMAVMAALTVALMDDIRLAVKRTVNVQAYAQADWQAQGAEDFVKAYLQNDFQKLEPAAQAVLLQTRTPLVLPTPDGMISLTLKDASHCFNLNLLVSADGKENGQARLQFVELAGLLGLPDNQAVALSSALIDWQDSNQQLTIGGAEDGTYLRHNPPYRTADTALRSPEEMRAIEGMDEELWELFRPFVCTGPPGEESVPYAININGLLPERLLLLAASLGSAAGEQSPTAVAQTLLLGRPAAGYDAAELQAKFIEMGLIEQGGAISGVTTNVTSVFVEVTTQVGPAERIRTYRYDGVDTTTPRLTYRGWGRETFRPEIETELDAQ